MPIVYDLSRAALVKRYPWIDAALPGDWDSMSLADKANLLAFALNEARQVLLEAR